MRKTGPGAWIFICCFFCAAAGIAGASDTSIGVQAGDAVADLEKAARDAEAAVSDKAEEASRQAEEKAREMAEDFSLEAEKILRDWRESMTRLIETVQQEYRRFEETLEKKRSENT